MLSKHVVRGGVRHQDEQRLVRLQERPRVPQPVRRHFTGQTWRFRWIPSPRKKNTNKPRLINQPPLVRRLVHPNSANLDAKLRIPCSSLTEMAAVRRSPRSSALLAESIAAAVDWRREVDDEREEVEAGLLLPVVPAFRNNTITRWLDVTISLAAKPNASTRKFHFSSFGAPIR